MPKFKTLYFDELEYSEDAAFHFPAGIPGFEDQTGFVFLEQPHTQPLVFMQSLRNPELCFIAAPVFVVDPEYRLHLSAEEIAALELPAGETPRIGNGILCLALLTVSEDADPTANLMSPIVVNLQLKKGIQAMQAGPVSSLRHPLLPQSEAVPC